MELSVPFSWRERRLASHVSTLHHNDTIAISSVRDHHRAQMASGFGLNGGTSFHFLDHVAAPLNGSNNSL